MDHVWVSLQFTPIEVELKDDGSLDVSATETALELGEAEAIMACWFCDTKLTAESYGSECVPEIAAQAI